MWHVIIFGQLINLLKINLLNYNTWISSYDKSVDYWSFAVIAFEITCGMRPFLHGESPARWYPYVEEKAKNVIAIYRSESGSVEYSTGIPYNTHLSELFKKCFETWLKMMLQFEPKRRGCKVLMSTTTKEELSDKELNQVVGLNVLHNILKTQMLEIYCPSRKLAFAIGRSTTILDIQNWIYRDINVGLEDQLIVTLDGTQVLPNEPALKFFGVSLFHFFLQFSCGSLSNLFLCLLSQGVDLFMIPKNSSLLKIKLKIPKCVNKFLTTWETVKDPLVLRKVWISAVFFIKTEVEQMEMLKKANDALM